MTDFKRKHDYLVCIDSDGCAMDTMEIKQKECFCTALIEVFGLQGTPVRITIRQKGDKEE